MRRPWASVRRAWAVGVVSIGAALAAAASAQTSAQPDALGGADAPAAVEQVAAGVYVHRGVLEDWGPSNGGDVSNSAIVIGARCVAVIDTGGTPAVGARLLAAVRQLTPLPVCYVINTHAHPDHVLGNSAFAQANGGAAPTFVGHTKLPAALGSRGPYYLRALQRDFGAGQSATRIVAPDLLVDGHQTLDLGGRQLELTAWPTAHTDADLTVLDASSGTAFLGDLLFTDHTPALDGNLKGWLGVLEELRRWPNVRHAVPGHGPIGSVWPAALDPEQHYLRQLQADVRKAIRQGLTLEQTVQRVGPDRPGWLLQDVFQARNVTAAYAELEWED